MTSTLRPFWLRLLARLTLLLAFAAFAAGASAQSATITFFHNDALGSPAIATDANGDVLWKENYMPYGQPQQVAAAVPNNKLWFTGKPYDPGTGLSYFGARYYIPVIGRFTGMDPKGLAPEDPHSFNRYAYANNNPYKYVDPDGRASVLAVAGMGVLLIGGTYYALAPDSRQQEMRESIGRLARAIGNVLHSESAGSGDGADNGDSKAQDQERDSKRFYDKEARKRAQDRSRDADGDPTCEYCGVKTTDEPGKKNSSTVDHVKAWSKGGKTTDENSANACLSCNSSKGNRDLGTQWIPPNQR